LLFVILAFLSGFDYEKKDIIFSNVTETDTSTHVDLANGSSINQTFSAISVIKLSYQKDSHLTSV